MAHTFAMEINQRKPEVRSASGACRPIVLPDILLDGWVYVAGVQSRSEQSKFMDMSCSRHCRTEC